MKKVLSYLLIGCCPLFWLGCGGGDEEKPKVQPTNLTISADISDDGSGKVTFTATAENAVKYYYYFGEDSPDTGVLSEDGTAEYTYALTGSYIVKVVAYSQDNLSIDKSKTVNVTNELELAWSDEFDGTELDGTVWTHEVGNNGGWGNNELEYYQSNNTTVADGILTITAKEESVGGKSYTSSRIKTQGKKEIKYGRINISAKLPYGQGIWPALWMLGSNIGSAGWPACGEIDIMEMVGGTAEGKSDSKTYGTVHWSNASNQWTYVGGNKALTSGTFNDDFHLFSIIWTNNKISWLLDDVQFYSKDTSPAEMSEFRNSFFLIFNVAVGGNWPGNPDETTVFPQEMQVDYVRLYQ